MKNLVLAFFLMLGILISNGDTYANDTASGYVVLPKNIGEAIIAFNEAEVFMKRYDDCLFNRHYEYSSDPDLKVYETVSPIGVGGEQNPYHRYAILYKNRLLYEEGVPGGSILVIYFGKIANKGLILSNLQCKYGVYGDRIYFHGKEILPDISAVRDIRKMSQNYLIMKYATNGSGKFRIGVYGLNSGEFQSFLYDPAWFK